MLSVLASGILVADPVQRTGSNGKVFVTAQLRVPTDDKAISVSVIAFDKTACDALSKLHKGDVVSVTGKAKLLKWQGRDGERVGLSVTAERIRTAYALRTKRAASKKTNGAEVDHGMRRQDYGNAEYDELG